MTAPAHSPELLELIDTRIRSIVDAAIQERFPQAGTIHVAEYQPPTDDELAARREEQRARFAEMADDIREALEPFIADVTAGRRHIAVAHIAAKLYPAVADTCSAVKRAIEIVDEADKQCSSSA